MSNSTFRNNDRRQMASNQRNRNFQKQPSYNSSTFKEFYRTISSNNLKKLTDLDTLRITLIKRGALTKVSNSKFRQYYDSLLKIFNQLQEGTVSWDDTEIAINIIIAKAYYDARRDRKNLTPLQNFIEQSMNRFKVLYQETEEKKKVTNMFKKHFMIMTALLK